ncbi:protein-tyrosine phosphatase family protein [Spirochaeta africana]|uniref:Tyrosine specific protein phosphatases domain-containing protein n=1 Tax=Spirochaeta africana (strain ATCC 700263 / DSM 8902 / Z-7692) TaxID=889378 RepID=H9UK09_SPIAZ|nr:protein-tyrosine phosphatase family protein [Spirochaeta africana]AFG37852.1 putative protein-tyrosine phosphatase [Spirochaeta africana DSM 8902]
MRNYQEQLYLGPMPGSTEPLSSWLEDVRTNGITLVICLTPPHEIEKKSPEYARLLNDWTLTASTTVAESPSAPPPDSTPAGSSQVDTDSHPEVIQLAVGDNQAPEDPAAFWKAVESTAAHTKAGGKAFIHCRGGRGRTGLFAAAVLMQQGKSAEEALAAIKPAGSYPESADQQAFLRRAPL